MKKIERILVPLDFSDFSINALDVASELATQFSAQIYLLHIIDLKDLYGMNDSFSSQITNIEEILKNTASEKLKQIASKLSIHSINEVRLGPPATEIKSFIEEEKIDLLVLASHGRSGLKHLFMGSVAQKCVQISPCSVWVVKA